ncbi:SURF1 family cytochrome oxidase biogenesis protein [Micrococcoides hystricis]|uniref:SURF1-like protein n=1 Tax=Micrococcoides hystricis TaxID=1572761 RepID=A0ABV6P8M3_9MICC
MTESSNVRAPWWRRYSFLLTGKWIGAFLLTCLFAVATYFLGTWQMDRHQYRQAQIGQIDAVYDATPLTGAAGIRIFTDYESDDEWTPVELRGSYHVDDAVIIRNRTRGGQPGYETTVPFTTTEGTTIVVSRGWLPIGNNEHGQPDEIPLPVDTAATGATSTIVVRAKAGEPVLDREAPDGQLATINLDQYQDQVGYPVAQAGYGQLVEENPAAATMPEPLLRPSTDEGPHLSYSWQWFLFGILGFIGYGYAARRTAFAEEQAQLEYGEEETHRHAAWRPDVKKVKRRRDGSLSDEEAEDLLLDGR